MPGKSPVTQQHVSAEMRGRAEKMRKAMTPAEAQLWQRLRAGRLEGLHFRRQQIIGHYIADFYCHAARLVIEVDGGVHLAQQAYDQQRDDELQAQGFQVMRFTNRQVEQEMDAVLGEILAVFRRIFQQRLKPATLARTSSTKKTMG